MLCLTTRADVTPELEYETQGSFSVLCSGGKGEQRTARMDETPSSL